MSLAAVLVLSHAAVAVLGGVLGYLVRRPPARRSSLELRAPGAERQAAGRHRRR